MRGRCPKKEEGKIDDEERLLASLIIPSECLSSSSVNARSRKSRPDCFGATEIESRFLVRSTTSAAAFFFFHIHAMNAHNNRITPLSCVHYHYHTPYHIPSSLRYCIDRQALQRLLFPNQKTVHGWLLRKRQFIYPY